MCETKTDTTTALTKSNPAVLLTRIAQQHDQQAFIMLFQHYAPKVKSWLIKGGASPSVAEEIIQETFLTVWRKAGLFDPEKASAATWIYTIARHKKIDKLRKEQYPEVFLEAPLEAVTLENSSGDTKKDVRKALKVLNPEQFTVIYKNFFEGRSHQEIAKQEGVALGTVKSRARLALKKLHAVLNIGHL
jgi:RNA polymerase sigma-70 factor (ECF subfamily)